MFTSETCPSSARSRKRENSMLSVCPDVKGWIRAKRIKPPTTQAIVMLRWRGSMPPSVGGRCGPCFGSSLRCHGLRRVGRVFSSFISSQRTYKRILVLHSPLASFSSLSRWVQRATLGSMSNHRNQRTIAVVGGDLMARSRIDAAAAANSLEVQRLSPGDLESLDTPPDVALVVLD